MLVTHEHDDHNHVELVTLKSTGTVIREKDMLVNGVYKTRTFMDLLIEAVPAYNKNHNVNECVGYFITVDGVKIYAAGDTSETDFMHTLFAKHIDWAILPTDGVFNMSAKEAARCARIIGAKHSIPVHTKPGELFDEKVAKQFDLPSRVIVHPGEEITL